MDDITRTTRTVGKKLPELMRNQATADSLWDFCLKHYADQEVQQACLKIQEKYNGNINLLLFFAWVEDAGFTFDIETVVALRTAIHESEGLIRRYRIMRRDLKSQINAQSYNKMLNYELSLEKFQQYEIISCANTQKWNKSGSSAVILYCELLDKYAKDHYCAIMKGLRTFAH